MGASEVKIKTTLATVGAIIGVLDGPKDQEALQGLLVPRLLAIHQKLPNEVLDVLVLLIQHQRLGSTHL